MQMQPKKTIIAIVVLLIVLIVAFKLYQRTKHAEVAPQEPTQTINKPTEVQKEMPVAQPEATPAEVK